MLYKDIRKSITDIKQRRKEVAAAAGQGKLLRLKFREVTIMDLVILVGSFFVMLFAGFPIAFALLLSALLYMVMFSSGVPLIIIAQQLLKGVDSFTLLAIPFFFFS